MERYCVECEVFEREEIGKYTTFGIVCGNAKISDVTTNEREAAQIATLLNEGDVAICHFKDVVENLIARL